MKDISVIIPIYTPSSPFEKCIESLKKQTLSYEKFELILILNGAKEPYDSFIIQCTKDLPIKVKYFYIPEKGVSNARNFGIRNAKSKYITFIDSDDWISDNYLEALLHQTEQTKRLIISNVVCYNEQTGEYYLNFLGKSYNKLREKRLYSHLRIKSFFSVPFGKLLPTGLCKQFFFNNLIEYGEDALFMFSIEPFLDKAMKSVDNPIYYYRKGLDNSLSQKKRNVIEICKIHGFLLIEYWRIYLKNISKYNVIFFINRNLAILKHILKGK